MTTLLTPASAQDKFAYVAHDKVTHAIDDSGSVLSVPDVAVRGLHLKKNGSFKAVGNTVLYVLSGSAAMVQPAASWNAHTLEAGDAIVLPAHSTVDFRAVSSPLRCLVFDIPESVSKAPAKYAFIGHEQVAATLKKAGPLAEGAGFRFSGGYRTGPYAPADYRPDVEVHETSADLFFVVDGTATQTLGGTVVGGHSTGAGEIRGAKIDGGSTFHLSKGDVVWVRKSTPHWFPEIPTPLSYLLIKILY